MTKISKITATPYLIATVALCAVLHAAVPATLGASVPCAAPVNAQVHACMRPVKRYAEVLSNSTKAALATGNGGLPAFSSFTNLGQEVFKELCALIKRFDFCVENARRQCPRHMTLQLMNASYGYLCNQGYQTFYDNADCLMDLDQRPEAKTCHDETMSVIHRLNTQPTMKFEAKMAKMCSALNFFASCVRAPISSHCGGDSWRVIHRVLRDTTQTVMPGCPFETTLDDAADDRQPATTHRPQLPAPATRITWRGQQEAPGRNAPPITYEPYNADYYYNDAAAGRQGRRGRQPTAGAATRTPASRWWTLAMAAAAAFSALRAASIRGGL